MVVIVNTVQSLLLLFYLFSDHYHLYSFSRLLPALIILSVTNFYQLPSSASTTVAPIISESMMAYTDNRKTYNDYLRTQGRTRQLTKTVASLRKSVNLGANCMKEKNILFYFDLGVTE